MFDQVTIGFALAVGIILQLIGLMIVGFVYKDQPTEKDVDTKPGNQAALVANLSVISVMTTMWVTLGIFGFQSGTSTWIQNTFNGVAYGIVSLGFLVTMGLVSFVTITLAKSKSNEDMKIRLDSAMIFQLCSLIAPIFILYILWNHEALNKTLTGGKGIVTRARVKDAPKPRTKSSYHETEKTKQNITKKLKDFRDRGASASRELGDSRDTLMEKATDDCISEYEQDMTEKEVQQLKNMRTDREAIRQQNIAAGNSADLKDSETLNTCVRALQTKYDISDVEFAHPVSNVNLPSVAATPESAEGGFKRPFSSPFLPAAKKAAAPAPPLPSRD